MYPMNFLNELGLPHRGSPFKPALSLFLYTLFTYFVFSAAMPRHRRFIIFDFRTAKLLFS